MPDNRCFLSILSKIPNHKSANHKYSEFKTL